MDFQEYAESMLTSTDESYVGKAMDLRFDVVDFMKNTLEERAMTQAALAHKMNMKDSQLTRIMNAESNITLETVARIFHAFGLRPTIQERQEIYAVVSGDQGFSEPMTISQGNLYKFSTTVAI